MNIVISGYGPPTEKTLALYSIIRDDCQVVWESAVENASFVCKGDMELFTITEKEDYSVVYYFQRRGMEYVLADQRKLSGGSLCHITYSQKNKALFGACYGTGTIFSIRVDKGCFGELLHHEIQYGADPSDLTRAHCVLLYKEEKELITVNIALDQICFYDISEGSLNLTRVLEVPRGVGPRHAIASETEELLYIITEYSNEILVYEHKPEMKLLQRISTLPENYKEESFCSTLCFSKDHRYLYAANRGADSIVLFQVEADGQLQKIKDFNCGGKYPRHMIITEDGAHLIVCNQNSNNTVVFELDVLTGYVKEKLIGIPFRIPSGVLEIVI